MMNEDGLNLSIQGNQTRLAKIMATMGARLESMVGLLSAVASLSAVPIKYPELKKAAEEILNILVIYIEDLRGCSLMLYDPPSGLLKILAARGPADVVGEFEGPYNKDLAFKPGEGIAGQAFKKNNPIFWDKTSADNQALTSALSTPSSLACFPLSLQDRCIGIMNISFHSSEPLDATRKRDLLLLCGVVANVIQTFILKNEVGRNADALREKVSECEIEIAERKRVETALRVTQFSVDSAAEGVFWIESNGRFVYVNHSACDRLGYTVDELLSMTVYDIDPAFPVEAWPEQWNEVRNKKSVSLESSHRTKSGELVPVEIMINHLEFEGREYHIVHARDITDRKQAERKQREIINQLEVILHGVADGIYAMDPSGQVVFANDAAAKSFGYPSARAMLDDPFFEEVMKKFEITDESGQPIPIDRLPGRQALEGERSREQILRFRTFGQDDEQWSIIKAVPIFGEKDEVRLSVVIRHDITGIKVAEQERDRLIMKLKDALAEVKTLQGFIPICANCKKIRDDEGFWQQIEKYIQDRSDAKFSHSICPECAKLLYPHLYS